VKIYVLEEGVHNAVVLLLHKMLAVFIYSRLVSPY